MFNHFLITRYNLNKEDWEKDKFNNTILTETWLENRRKLFENYCLPSVVAQTCTNFKWLIFFQEGTIDAAFLNNLKDYPFITPIFVQGYSEFDLRLPDHIRANIYADPEFIISTRLDNDDAIHEDFVMEIQKFAHNVNNNTVLHFPFGLCLESNSNSVRLAKDYYPLNQFISLKEDYTEPSRIRGVYVNLHYSWREPYVVKALYRRDMWLQVIHSSNKINEFRGFPAFSSALKGFKIKHQHFGWGYDLRVAFLKLKKRLSNFSI